jgi:hypothetical protein
MSAVMQSQGVRVELRFEPVIDFVNESASTNTIRDSGFAALESHKVYVKAHDELGSSG